MSPAFRLPTRTVIAPGAIDLIADQLSARKVARPLLVFDAGIARTPWPDRLLGSLNTLFERVETFSDVEPNPKAATVDRATERARTLDIDLVVAVGGGSVLDAGKAMAMLVTNEGSCVDYEGRNRFPNASAPFIAVPTTCGTGSEVTWVAVISDAKNRRKISIKGESMFPFAALVDADVIRTLPPSLIAQTGMDAMTHALEAFVSRRANPVSDVLATRAVGLLLEHLEACVSDPEQDTSRTAVMKASTLAGMAFGNADVGAVHCLSESIGGLYDHPHGLLNARLLVPVFRYQMEAVDGRLRGMIDGLSTGALLDHLDRLVERLSIPPLKSLKLPSGSAATIGSMAEANNSNASNPVVLESSDYERILSDLAVGI